jgi:hypothetical protein
VSTTDQWEVLFGGGRKWRIAEEVTGTTRRPGRHGEVVTSFTRGRFEITNGAFRSPLSTNLGRRGWFLVETNADGSRDLEPRSTLSVGLDALDEARKKYEAVW